MLTKDYVPVLKNKGIFIYLPSYTVFCVLKLSAVCSNYSINGLLFCVPLKLIKLDLVVSTTSNDERKKQTTIVLERTKSIHVSLQLFCHCKSRTYINFTLRMLCVMLRQIFGLQFNIEYSYFVVSSLVKEILLHKYCLSL